jgi:hypothetical protein
MGGSPGAGVKVLGSGVGLIRVTTGVFVLDGVGLAGGGE